MGDEPRCVERVEDGSLSMNHPYRHSILAAILPAIMWALAGCSTHQPVVSSITAKPIGTMMHKGLEVSVFDANQVRCDKSTPPVYPTEAKRNRIQGVGVVRIIVDQTGEAIDYTVVSSSPTAEFGQAVLDAAKRWKYYPMADENGRPVIYILEQTIRFNLGEEMPAAGGGWNGL
ncbi:energy transducer TonB [Oleiharenicola lentus]|uniref:Energy transducer TonB n=2 Tax=Oleiharenicola lentus TaxID=2508720 RepID=A0A4V1M6G0_9BACT|nr:energy transducer TonB [Oleiharenicola lentus]